jgi:hypothetical protein
MTGSAIPPLATIRNASPIVRLFGYAASGASALKYRRYLDTRPACAARERIKERN